MGAAICLCPDCLPMFFRCLLARAAPLKCDNEENRCGEGVEVTEFSDATAATYMGARP